MDDVWRYSGPRVVIVNFDGIHVAGEVSNLTAEGKRVSAVLRLFKNGNEYDTRSLSLELPPRSRRGYTEVFRGNYAGVEGVFSVELDLEEVSAWP